MKSENIVMLIAIALAPCADYMPQQGRGQKRTFWRNRLAPPRANRNFLSAARLC
jgi:hypothetical protein